ncbi:MAG: NADP-dependent isocitrate dehydrogenase, partial [Planctomycetota bacterium]
LDWDEPGRDPNALGQRLTALQGEALELRLITNRGVKVYPDGFPETFCTDHWRCRFLATADGGALPHGEAIALLARLEEAGFDFIKTEHLYRFDGVRGWSLGQGE